MFMRPEAMVPVDRLIENTKRYIEQHPDDPVGYGQLARACSLAFAYGEKMKEIGVFNPQSTNEAPRFEDHGQRKPDVAYRKPGQATPKELAYLLDSVRNYEEAVKRAPDNLVYWLGLGYVFEIASREVYTLPENAKTAVDWEVVPKEQRACEDKALEAYRKAFSLDKSRAGDLFPSIAQEAAQSIASLIGRRKDPSEEDKRDALRFTRIAKDIEMSRGHMVTPIIFDLGGNHGLSGLLASKKKVCFDLDGSGRNLVWNWVKPGTSLLVWDPHGTGRITSGRQLIGSVTWWLFWDTGYRVLAALDDDNDGWLRGKELDGLGVWTDANGNAVSDPGEVVPIRNAGVEALSVTVAGKSEGMPFNPQGLRMNDGRTLATYDWVAKGHAGK